MQELTLVLGIMAALLHLAAYTLYSLQTRAGRSNPKIASWGVWVLLSVMNALSYEKMSGDWIASLQFLVGSVACVITFSYVVMIGRFERLQRREWILFSLGLVALLVWWIFRTATGANMIILLAFGFSFWPTLQGVWQDPARETPLAWIFWTLAFSTTVVNIFLREGRFITLISPVIMLGLHCAVAILCSQRKKQH